MKSKKQSQSNAGRGMIEYLRGNKQIDTLPRELRGGKMSVFECMVKGLPIGTQTSPKQTYKNLSVEEREKYISHNTNTYKCVVCNTSYISQCKTSLVCSVACSQIRNKQTIRDRQRERRQRERGKQ